MPAATSMTVTPEQEQRVADLQAVLERLAAQVPVLRRQVASPLQPLDLREDTVGQVCEDRHAGADPNGQRLAAGGGADRERQRAEAGAEQRQLDGRGGELGGGDAPLARPDRRSRALRAPAARRPERGWRWPTSGWSFHSDSGPESGAGSPHGEVGHEVVWGGAAPVPLTGRRQWRRMAASSSDLQRCVRSSAPVPR